MESSNGNILHEEVYHQKEIQPSTPLSYQFDFSKSPKNVNRSSTSYSFSTPTLPIPNILTPRSIPNNRRLRPHFPSSVLFSDNSSPRKPSLLHSASINGDKPRLHYALSEGGLPLLESRDKFGRTAIIYACLGDWPECVAILLSAGASPISVDEFGRNAFHWAAVKGLYSCYKIMFKHEEKSIALHGGDKSVKVECIGWRMKDKEGAIPLHLSTCASSTKCLSYILKYAKTGDIDCQDGKKRTPLHWAAASGNTEAIRLLLKAKAKIDVLDENGKPPFFYATSSKGKHAVLCLKFLLDKEPTMITWQDNEGRSAFHLAVADQDMDVEMIEALLYYSKNWNELKDKHGRTPLHWAAILERVLSAKSLLGSFTEASFLSDMYGATPLHYAALSIKPDIISQITSLNSNVLDIVDSEGRTALMWAANNDSCAVIQELAKLGANIDYCDKCGHSALHLASMNGSLTAVKLLLELGADINSKDEIGNTPLAYACEFGHLEVFLYLKDSKADVETTNKYSRTLSHLASASRNALILQRLAKIGVDLNIRDVLGLTPLHLACQNGLIDCCSILLENGADCNIQDINGYCPIHFAVYGDHEEIVQLLLDHSVDLNIVSLDGKTALDICNELGHSMLAEWLINCGAVSSIDL